MLHSATYSFEKLPSREEKLDHVGWLPIYYQSKYVFCFAKFYAQLPITCYIIHFLNVNHGKILRQICSALSPIFSLGNIGDCPLRYTVLF